MAISVVCQKCGKSLKVKDEWMGKRATCPGCGNSFIVGAAAAPAGKPGVTAFNPHAATAAKKQREEAAGKFSISPGLIIGGIALLLLFGGIGAFIAGPKKVNAQWDALGDKPESDVISVVSRGLECHYQSLGMYNPRKARGRPEARTAMFYRPTFVMSMPDQVKFKGETNLGPMEGFYNPHTGEVDATVAIGGGIGIPGSGGKKTSGASVSIKGKLLKNGEVETFVNGKQLKLVMPPPSADDEL